MTVRSWTPISRLAIQSADAAPPADWTPPVDILETTDAYVIAMELPGLDRDDVHVTVEGRQITLEGQRPRLTMSGAQYHRMERGQGRFRRVFAMPLAIDRDRVTAEADGGVVTVTLPKIPPPEARRVEIR